MTFELLKSLLLVGFGDSGGQCNSYNKYNKIERTIYIMAFYLTTYVDDKCGNKWLFEAEKNWQRARKKHIQAIITSQRKAREAREAHETCKPKKGKRRK